MLPRPGGCTRAARSCTPTSCSTASYRFASTARDYRYAARSDLEAPLLRDLARLDDAEFRQKFSGSPIKRIGRGRFVRNVLYAIGNSEDAGLRTVAGELTQDEDETVADAARWAEKRLS